MHALRPWGTGCSASWTTPAPMREGVNLVSGETNYKECPGLPRGLRLLENRGDAHAARRAHRDDAASGAGFLRELFRELSDDARARGRERMADGHARTIHVELRAIDAAERRVEAELVPAVFRR